MCVLQFCAWYVSWVTKQNNGAKSHKCTMKKSGQGSQFAGTEEVSGAGSSFGKWSWETSEEGEKEKEIEHRELGCSYFPQFLRPGVEDGPKEW